jgi:hypothetical protein
LLKQIEIDVVSLESRSLTRSRRKLSNSTSFGSRVFPAKRTLTPASSIFGKPGKHLHQDLANISASVSYANSANGFSSSRIGWWASSPM